MTVIVCHTVVNSSERDLVLGQSKSGYNSYYNLGALYSKNWVNQENGQEIKVILS